jgi:uncharacterized membrane protein
MDQPPPRRDDDTPALLRFLPDFLLRFVRSRPYLLAAVALGVAVGMLAPGHYNWLRRALIGWNSGVWTYLVVMMTTMMRADHRKVHEIAAQQDESGGAVLVAVIIGAVLSVSAIVTELANMKEASRHVAEMHYVFTALTVIGSWLLVGVMYCFHYAHLYYTANKNTLPLKFPEGHIQPNYWDFLYFSFTLSVAVQTSDVSVMTRSMRKLVLGHCVLAFFFNLVILGLSVNIAASLVNT